MVSKLPLPTTGGGVGVDSTNDIERIMAYSGLPYVRLKPVDASVYHPVNALDFCGPNDTLAELHAIRDFWTPLAGSTLELTTDETAVRPYLHVAATKDSLLLQNPTSIVAYNAQVFPGTSVRPPGQGYTDWEELIYPWQIPAHFASFFHSSGSVDAGLNPDPAVAYGAYNGLVGASGGGYQGVAGDAVDSQSLVAVYSGNPVHVFYDADYIVSAGVLDLASVWNGTDRIFAANSAQAASFALLFASDPRFTGGGYTPELRVNSEPTDWVSTYLYYRSDGNQQAFEWNTSGVTPAVIVCKLADGLWSYDVSTGGYLVADPGTGGGGPELFEYTGPSYDWVLAPAPGSATPSVEGEVFFDLNLLNFLHSFPLGVTLDTLGGPPPMPFDIGPLAAQFRSTTQANTHLEFRGVEKMGTYRLRYDLISNDPPGGTSGGAVCTPTPGAVVNGTPIQLADYSGQVVEFYRP